MKKSIKERFFDKIEKSDDGCWNWIAGKNSAGYGVLKISGKSVYAHRLSFELFIGPIPEGLCVCHQCDKRGCVRPDHFFLGTKADNWNDMIRKGRRSVIGELNDNSKLNEEDVILIKDMLNHGRSMGLIASDFDVSKTCVAHIKYGNTWSYL